MSRSRSSSSSLGCGGAGGGGGSSAGIRTLPVVLEPGPGRNQPAHRDVLLQAAQVIDLAGDGRLGEHARRFLERRRRDERVGRERRLRDAEQQRPALRRTPARGNHALVLLEEPELVRLLVDEEFGVADVLDLDPPHHLPRDGLDVLVVDVDALQPVDLLNLVHEVRLQRLLAEHVQDVVRVATDRPSAARPRGRARLPAR